jgi:spermidine synthase
MKIIVLSIACCEPSAALFDQEYIERINAALAKTGVEATVEKVAGTDAIFGLNNVSLEKLVPLFEKYGMAVAPVLFINGELMLYGGVPTIERLVEVIDKAKSSNQP